MKHFFLLAAASLGVLCANAEVKITVSDINEETQLMGEAMSANATYVVGSNFATFAPCAWNVETGEYFDFMDYEEGSFHAVNNDGYAVGDDGTHAIAGMVNGELVELWRYVGEEVYDEEFDYWFSTGDAGSSAYAMTADGQTIFGYYYDSTYATTPCYWRNGERVDLPVPSDEEVGFMVNGGEVRWCTADGKILLGYIIDDMGTWPACVWRLGEDGNYVCDPVCKDYFELDYGSGKPYMLFTPYGLSDNGEWISLSIQDEYDAWNWAPETPIQIARMNLTTGALEVLDADLGAMTTPSCIANDGTTYIITGALSGMVGRGASVWQAGSDAVVDLEELTGSFDELAGLLGNTVCTVSGDGSQLQGFGLTEDGDIFSYIISMQDATKLNALAQQGEAKIFTLSGEQISEVSAPGIYVVNGQKVLVK